MKRILVTLLALIMTSCWKESIQKQFTYDFLLEQITTIITNLGIKLKTDLTAKLTNLPIIIHD